VSLKKLAAAGRWSAMLFLYHARDVVIKDWKGTILQEEPLREKCSRGNDCCDRNMAME
jgi:hypothetical protein